MMQPHYSNEQLFGIAKESYDKLVLFCESLDSEGYWEEAKAYLHKDIYEILDLYLQSVLLNINVYCGRNEEMERKFLVKLPNTNALQCTVEGDLSEDVLNAANKILRTPPIILQLCGVRDKEKQSFFSSIFLDKLLNILICSSMLGQKQNSYAQKFFQEFYRKNAFFVNEDQREYVVDERYLFVKLSAECFYEIEAPVERLKEQRIREKEEAEFAEKEEKNKKKTELEHKKLMDVENAKRMEKVEKEIQEVERIIREEKEARERKEEKKEPEQIIKVEPRLEISEVIKKEDVDSVQKKKEISKEEKQKSIFGYSDDDLRQLQQMGKLKIQAPKIKELKELSKKAAMQRAEDEKVEQIRREIDKINHAEKLQGLLEELNQLIGLEEVKKEIESLINLIKVKKMRESYQMPSMDITYHMVFTGNPGTGKTTVARLVAKIYKELGILSEGHLVEVDRAGLVAGYVGQTAMKVKEVVERSLGGVLFIDEAYALSNKNDANDFGGEAIDTLVKMMEDHRDDLVVIVAGYKKEMEVFLKANTGLISRFNKFVDFKDYTNEELMEILGSFSKKSGVELENDAKEEIRKTLESMDEKKKALFGNARGMRNTFENIMMKQANRIVTLSMPTVEQLKTIKKEDVIGVLEP